MPSTGGPSSFCDAGAARRRVLVPLRRLGGRSLSRWRARGIWLGSGGRLSVRWPGRTLRGPALRRRLSAARRDLWGRSPRASLLPCLLARFLSGKIGEAFACEPIDLAGDQPFDFEDIFLVGGSDDRKRDAGFASATGAANPMDIILRMGRDIEIEHMADVWNIEPARRDVRANDEVDAAALERIERGRAGALIHVAMQARRH